MSDNTHDAAGDDETHVPHAVEEEFDEFDRTVERVDRGFRVKASLKRGNDPRDEERITLESKGGNLDEAAAEMDEAIETHLPRWAAKFREHQPTEVEDTVSDTSDESEGGAD